MDSKLAKALQNKRGYINSLEKLFISEDDYGFGNHINNMRQDYPEEDFYNLTIGNHIDNYSPITDFYGEPIPLDANNPNFNKQIENYLYHLLLNTNDYD